MAFKVLHEVAKSFETLGINGKGKESGNLLTRLCNQSVEDIRLGGRVASPTLLREPRGSLRASFHADPCRILSTSQ